VTDSFSGKDNNNFFGSPDEDRHVAAGTLEKQNAALSGPLPTTVKIEIPEPLTYRLKKKLLGPPLVTEKLSEQKLSNVIALGVLSPDCISSTAYGTEEILTQLVPAVGIAAFGLIMPITFAVVAVLFFVTLSYREVVMVYTKAGGSYVVSRENFGPRFAQVAAVALIIDYTVTVAVQTAAGTDALTSAFPKLIPYQLPITLAVVVILCYGNLRGIREAGKIFALPTYLFIVGIGSLVIVGFIRSLMGQLNTHPINVSGALSGPNHLSSGLFAGAGLFVVLRAFANGGSSLTGLEAISNGVANFRSPQGKNARKTLVSMSSVLGFLVLGVSFLAWRTHAVPYLLGSPTVLSQEAKYVFGNTLFGKICFYFIQAATMVILYTGANTSFNGFPNLASFVAKDAFLPKRLTKRGHRLVFSNGIIILAVAAGALLIVTRARVDALVAVYAIGVFTGFTIAGAGMVKHHLTNRESKYKRKLVINGFAAVLSFLVVIIFAVTKFTQGAWAVVVLFPILVWSLIKLHSTYIETEKELEQNVQKAVEAPILKRHVVMVLVDRFDLAAARAIQYARTLSMEVRAVHFLLDTRVAHELEDSWSRLGIAGASLEIVECQDRRLGRSVMEYVAEVAYDGETEVSVLLPRAVYTGLLRRIVHDRASERLSAMINEIPNASATIIAYPLGQRKRITLPEMPGSLKSSREETTPKVEGDTEDTLPSGFMSVAGTTPIKDTVWRKHARIVGRVKSVRIQPGAGISSLECILFDPTDQILLIFQGKRSVPGIEPGTIILAEGIVGDRAKRKAMINPSYTILQGADSGEDN